MSRWCQQGADRAGVSDLAWCEASRQRWDDGRCQQGGPQGTGHEPSHSLHYPGGPEIPKLTPVARETHLGRDRHITPPSVYCLSIARWQVWLLYRRKTEMLRLPWDAMGQAWVSAETRGAAWPARVFTAPWCFCSRVLGCQGAGAPRVGSGGIVAVQGGDVGHGVGRCPWLWTQVLQSHSCLQLTLLQAGHSHPTPIRGEERRGQVGEGLSDLNPGPV